jgi:tetratricopeptide (TPR) repeat protein
MVAVGLLVVAVLIALAAVAAWQFISPRPAPTAKERGWAAVRSGDWVAARQAIRELRQAPATEAESTLLHASILLKKGFPYPALDELEKVKADAGVQERALTLTGEAWYALGRHIEAQNALNLALEKNPDAVDAHRWLAASYYDMGAITDALVHLQRIAELDPSDQRPLRLIGLIYKDYERYEDAVPAYQESLRRKSDQPDWAQVRQELAACLIKLLRNREALQTLEPCVPSPPVLVLRAECYYALNESEQAKKCLRDVLAADPHQLDALVLAGTIALEESRHEEAIASLQLAVEHHPKDYKAHFKLAQAYAQTNRPEEAAREQKQADYLRDLRKVFADLHQVAWDHPEDMRVRLRLAQLARELDRPDLEDVWMKAASALGPIEGKDKD